MINLLFIFENIVQIDTYFRAKFRTTIILAYILNYVLYHVVTQEYVTYKYKIRKYLYSLQITFKQLKQLSIDEGKRQKKQINLIASESICPQNILNLLATPFNNKYAEGYKNNRFYAGIKNCNKIEDIAIQASQQAFRTNYNVNVQALSGANANLISLNAVCKQNDKVAVLGLQEGGHLSHCSSVSLTSKLYKPIKYHLHNNEIDLNEIEQLCKRHHPKVLIAGWSAYCKDIDWKQLKQAIGDDTILLADISHTAGLISANLLNSPFEYADIITSTTHKTLCGVRGAVIFSRNQQLGKQIDKSCFPQIQGGPHVNQIAGIAGTMIQANTKQFKNTMKKVIKNRQILQDIFTEQIYDNLWQKQCDNHQIIIDKVDGKKIEQNLEKQGIIINRQALKHDKNGSTSGIRLGTTIISQQNISKHKLQDVANLICKEVKNNQKK